MPDPDSTLHPPRWAHSLLLRVLPCDPMRDAILGDLHEEFARDVAELGERQARVRHDWRATGIMMRALFDSAICRSWVSTDPPAPPCATAGSPPAPLPAPPGDVGIGHARGLAGYVGFAALALVVLAVGIVANTMLFSAAQLQGPRVSSAAGAGGVALLLACVAIGAVIMCAGPRWRRKRLRDA